MEGKYPYYRVTTYLDTQSDCMEWYEWFESLGMPVYLVRDNWRMYEGERVRRERPYAIWVDGEEAVSGNHWFAKPNSEEMTGEVLKQSGALSI